MFFKITSYQSIVTPVITILILPVWCNKVQKYDPIFYLPSYRKTMSELEQKEKNLLSHRSDALRKVSSILPKLINDQQ